MVHLLFVRVLSDLAPSLRLPAHTGWSANHLLFYFIYGFILFSDARFGRAIDKQAWYALVAGVVLVVIFVFMDETKTHIDFYSRVLGIVRKGHMFTFNGITSASNYV